MILLLIFHPSDNLCAKKLMGNRREKYIIFLSSVKIKAFNRIILHVFHKRKNFLIQKTNVGIVKERNECESIKFEFSNTQHDCQNLLKSNFISKSKPLFS